MDHPDVTMMYVVHKAFRRELARMQAAAAQADNPRLHQALRDSWTTFNQYLTIHHTAEDEMLWPPMRALTVVDFGIERWPMRATENRPYFCS